MRRKVGTSNATTVATGQPVGSSTQRHRNPHQVSNNNKSVVVTFRVTVEEYLRLKKRAAKSHISMTKFIVDKCLGDQPHYYSQPPLFKWKLRKP